MRKVEKRLDDLYATLPRLDCKRKCQASCGPLGMTQDEARRLSEALGHDELFDFARYQCAALGDDGLCTAYEARPGICRIFGLTKSLACPHGCEPERWMSKDESDRFLAQVEKITGRKPVIFTHDTLGRAILKTMRQLRAGKANDRS
jgi:uncharacterized protein